MMDWDEFFEKYPLAPEPSFSVDDTEPGGDGPLPMVRAV